ncbi:kinase-like protein [Epithele typhae]|uniref:kinase-like protein n=1 Tax=Epithele typhae TaxID=378194 RepID=UPI002007210C|nr:kinase-like protein [Epithele typhae]KAH9935943.1 kinase-like protein [Epithele typhae]
MAQPQAARNGHGDAHPDPGANGGARRHSGDEQSEDPAKSSSPVPSPGSDDGRARGRSRTRAQGAPCVESKTKRQGYHGLVSSFGKVFHVEKRWKLIRELGSGAYGFVVSAADEISGEPVAIKMVTRALDKVALAKRVLREITILRHFAHENITGLIDVDCSSDLSEMHIHLHGADLHQIIKSGQALTNEHVQYFVYQVLRGMKYIHSASVVHRDLKPGNLLVNADCELKICDFGLSRGFNSKPDENPTMMTEYVATRWYRAPEIMLVYKAYNTAIDVWSIGCIMAELMTGKPLFKGKDFCGYESLSAACSHSSVDQLNKILDVLGTPDDEVITRIASPKAQAYLRSLPWKKKVPFEKLIPMADRQAIDLLSKLMVFDPSARLTVDQALEHPWLSAYHDVADEPSCPEPFERWQDVEKLETLDDFREAIWNEIQDYRKEVRSVYYDAQESPERSQESRWHPPDIPSPLPEEESDTEVPTDAAAEVSEALAPPFEIQPPEEPAPAPTESPEVMKPRDVASPESIGVNIETRTLIGTAARRSCLVYTRRSSFMQPSRTNSVYSTYAGRSRHSSIAHPPDARSVFERLPTSAGDESSVAFPSQPQGEYVVPARSRTASSFGDTMTRRMLRTLSTVSIYESGEGLAGGLADIAPIGKFIVERDEGLPSEMPHEFDSHTHSNSNSNSNVGSSPSGKAEERQGRKEVRDEKDKARFHIHA